MKKQVKKQVFQIVSMSREKTISEDCALHLLDGDFKAKNGTPEDEKCSTVDISSAFNLKLV